MSHARCWETKHRARAMQLNDMLDACRNVRERRALYETFTNEERSGLLPEYIRRSTNREAPVGSLVKPKAGIGCSMWKVGGNQVFYANFTGLATVFGQREYGHYARFILLHPPWVDREGNCLWFAETSCHDLEVIQPGEKNHV